MKKKEKKARYTVECPVTFTFTDSEMLDRSDLLQVARKQLKKALWTDNYVMILRDLKVVDKQKVITKKEIKEQEQFWMDMLFKR